jgi:putative ABC transport system substrate-binding protein
VQTYAKELVAQKPELIIAAATQLAAALKRETRDIPIVFTGLVDPVGGRLIDGLARPGGNLTGTLLNEETIAGKWLAMLKEFAPATERVAILQNSKLGFFDASYGPAAQSAARTLRLTLVSTRFTEAADIERSLAAFAQTPNGALLVPPDIAALAHRDLIRRVSGSRPAA